MNKNNKKTILLVEDEAIIAMSETRMLERHGYAVVTAYSGEKAVESVDSNPEIALVLMDIDLGKGIDGTEAAGRILTGRDLPIVFLSSHTEREVVEKTEGITSYGYIVKNSGETVLIASVKMAFRLYDAHMELKRQKQDLNTALIRYEETAEELRSSEEKFRTMMSQSIDMIFLHDLKGNIVDVNHTAVKQTGYSREELLSMSVADLDPDYAEREDNGNFWKNVGFDTPYYFDARLRSKDNTLFPIEIVISKVLLGGNTYIMTFSRDISERKRAVQEIQEREESLRITLDSIGDAVISTDTNGNVVRMNPIAEKVCGWPFDEAKGKALKEVFHIVHSDTREPVDNPVARVLETGSITGLANHTLLISRDGSEYQIADSAAPIQNEDGVTTGVVMVFRDVTEEYRMTQALADSEHDMARAQALAQLGSWRFNLDTGTVTGSDQARKIYGVSHGDLTIEYVQTLPFPEYRPILDAALRALVEDGTPYDVEFKMHRPSDGMVRTIHSVAEYDQPHHRIVGTLQDITERRRAANNLQEALKEKDFLMKELNHRVKNSLAMVSSLIKLKDSETGMDLSDIQHQVEAIGLIHEKLYRTERVTEICLGDYFGDLLSSIFSSFTTRAVKIETTIDDLCVSTKVALALGLIVNEIATNAVKHGFSTREEAIFSIQMQKDRENRWYELTLSNTGNPFPDEISIDNSDTLGLRLISALVDQIHGTLELQKKPHPTFTIRFPVGP
jgi:PAS domain S-box-containing protein